MMASACRAIATDRFVSLEPSDRFPAAGPRAAIGWWLALFAAALTIESVWVSPSLARQTLGVVRSPNDELTVTVMLDERGRPGFEAARRGTAVVRGDLGWTMGSAPPLAEGLTLERIEERTIDETFSIPVGKAAAGRGHCRELVVWLSEPEGSRRAFAVAFRAYDDGLAFRYDFPDGQDESPRETLAELTSFRFSPDATAHYLPVPSYTTPYESYYQTRPWREIPLDHLIALPVLIEDQAASGATNWIGLSEADLTDFAGLYLRRSEGESTALAARPSPLPGRTDGALAVHRGAFHSPWRVLWIGDDPGKFLESQLVFHLNPPPAIDDVSWIRPGRTTFPWWNGYVLPGVDFKPGMNMATHKFYIDFCARHGIEYHSLEAAETTWYGGPLVPTGPVDVTRPIPELDLPELVRYAKERGVGIRLWVHWQPLLAQLEDAFPLYEQWGVSGVMVDFMDRDDQEMVQLYHRIAALAAKHHLTVTWHGAYKPTGMERTWPNVLTYEGVLNQEYNKWHSRATPPEHNLRAAFIRQLAGPLDYHVGAMRQVGGAEFTPRNENPCVPGTRAHQLALYVVYLNHLPMMVDYPQAYEGEPGFEFLTRIPVSWDETRVLASAFDRYLVIARRKAQTWYVGALAGSQAESLRFDLAFLGPGRYRAEVWEDSPSEGPRQVALRVESVDAGSFLQLLTAAGGGGGVARISPE